MSVMPIWGAIDIYRAKVKDGMNGEEGRKARYLSLSLKGSQISHIVLIGM
jgi:hypothetical protein